MLMKKDFYMIVNKLGLQDTDLDFAELIWEKCEKSMQGKTNQVPSLLTRPKINLTARQQPHKQEQDLNSLTREELMFLRDYLNKQLCTLSAAKIRMKHAIQRTWLKCNPDDSDDHTFRYLNELKDVMRFCKAKEKKMSGIQSKLKKQLGTK